MGWLVYGDDDEKTGKWNYSILLPLLAYSLLPSSATCVLCHCHISFMDAGWCETQRWKHRENTQGKKEVQVEIPHITV